MERSEKMLKNVLSELEENRNRESFPSMIAGAYALWLGRQKDVVDIENLPEFLEDAESDENIRNFVYAQLKDHWLEYRKFITAFDPEQLKQTILEMIPSGVKYSFGHSPDSFLELVTRILDIHANDCVADLGAGTGEFLCHAFGKNSQARYWGDELATTPLAIAKIRAKLLGGDITLVQEDMFDLARANEHNFDKVFCFPPLGMRLSRMPNAEKFLASLPSLPNLKGTVSGEWIFALKILDSLKDGGRAVVAMSPGGLFSTLDNEVRRYLLMRKSIEAVILLPAKLLDWSNTPIALVVLSSNHSTVRMINATEMGESNRRSTELRAEDIEQILNALNGKPFDWSETVDYRDAIVHGNMNPSHYTQKTVMLRDAVKFGTVITEISRGAMLSAPELDQLTSKEVTDCQYLASSSIKNGMIDEDLPYLSAIGDRQQRSCIRQGDIILSKIGTPQFKVALAEPQPGKKILANGNLFIIRVNEKKADACYIKAFLESELGQTLLMQASKGSVMPNLGATALQEMEISLPPLTQQKQIADCYRAKADEVAMLRRKLDAAVNALTHIMDL